MLSAIILSEPSYPTVLLAEQLVHQRFVLFGPLVLEKSPLKQQRLQQIGDQPVSRMFSLITKRMDYKFIHKKFMEANV